MPTSHSPPIVAPSNSRMSMPRDERSVERKRLSLTITSSTARASNVRGTNAPRKMLTDCWADASGAAINPNISSVVNEVSSSRRIHAPDFVVRLNADTELETTEAGTSRTGANQSVENRPKTSRDPVGGVSAGGQFVAMARLRTAHCRRWTVASCEMTQ